MNDAALYCNRYNLAIRDVSFRGALRQHQVISRQDRAQSVKDTVKGDVLGFEGRVSALFADALHPALCLDK
jgi:hypothetical protein